MVANVYLNSVASLSYSAEKATELLEGANTAPGYADEEASLHTNLQTCTLEEIVTESELD